MSNTLSKLAMYTSKSGNRKAPLPPLNRLSSTPSKQLQWVLDFAWRNLDEIERSAWLQLQEEIAVFFQLSLIELQGRPISPDDVLALGKSPLTIDQVQQFATTEYAKVVQGIAQHIILNALKDGRVRVPLDACEVLLMRMDDKFVAMQVPKLLTEPFKRYIVSLLIKAGHQITACPAEGCMRTHFVRQRKNQKFCSDTCKARANMQLLRVRKRHKMNQGRQSPSKIKLNTGSAKSRTKRASAKTKKGGENGSKARTR